jgi:SAM-dependent methyltransferase
MAGYGSFAAFYDVLTENVDHQGWATYLLSLFYKHQNKKPQVVLDLACGTGSLSTALLDNGVDVIGVDGSPDMLAVAMEKGESYGDRLMLLCQDMRELDLFGTVDGAVCMLDSINHLTEEKDIKEVFRRLGLFIEKDGLFIFDVNTPYKHEKVLGDNTFIYDEDEFYCGWQNSFDEKTCSVEMQLDFFLEEDGGYSRYTEYVKERAYTEETLRRLLDETGFEVLAVYGEKTQLPPKEQEERMVFVTRNLAKEQR